MKLFTVKVVLSLYLLKDFKILLYFNDFLQWSYSVLTPWLRFDVQYLYLGSRIAF